jgi:GNAT superfamily N-acetyltransferase
MLDLTALFRKPIANGMGHARHRFLPVTKERLGDLQRFSEAHGKFRYCSCMRWRLTSSDFKRSTKDGRVRQLERLVADGVPVGLLAYDGDIPIGWCSVAPRETYAGLERYEALSRIDDAPVWSVVCFFIDAAHRRSGVTGGLLKAAVEYAKSCGARIVEGYPVEADARLYTYMGATATFTDAGFDAATPAGRDRAIVRLRVR